MRRPDPQSLVDTIVLACCLGAVFAIAVFLSQQLGLPL